MHCPKQCYLYNTPKCCTLAKHTFKCKIGESFVLLTMVVLLLRSGAYLGHSDVPPGGFWPCSHPEIMHVTTGPIYDGPAGELTLN